MKFFSGETVFKFNWDQVVKAFWNRYPNPHSKHVLSEDVVSREVIGDKLFTKRLLCKAGRLPRWGERYFGGLKYVYIVEESVIDLHTKTLTTYTRNIANQHFMSIEEKCVYTVCSESSSWVDCQRQAWIDSGVRGLTGVVSSYGLKRFKKNINNTVEGFNYVLRELFDQETNSQEKMISEQTKKSSEKIKESAKKASNMAKTMTTKLPRREPV